MFVAALTYVRRPPDLCLLLHSLMFVFAITYARILATSAIASLIVCAYIGIHYRIMTNVNIIHNSSLEVLLD